MSKKASILITLCLLFMALIPFVAFLPHAAYADAKGDVCAGVGLTAGQNGCTPAAGSPSVDSIASTVINAFSVVVGIIAVIMIIIGGLKYITSTGDSNNTNSAKNTILYAIIGLVVVALAQIIVREVLYRLSK